MLATTPSRRGLSLTRRALSALLALAVATVGAIAGLVGVAGPASAGVQATCSWTELVGLPQGIRAAEFSASTDGWLVLFVDGVRRDDQSMWLRGTIKQADADFAAQVEADVIEWRWYDPAVIDSESLATITHATPFVCDFNWPLVAPPTAQSIDFTQPADVAHGETPAPLVVSATSGLSVTTESLTPEVCTVDGVDVTLVGVGECTIEATQDGGVGPDEVTYAAASAVSRTFNVNAGSLHQDVQFTDPLNMRLGEGSQVLLATADSEGPIWFESLTPEVCIATNRASNSTVSADALGECTVRAHQDGGPVGDGRFAYNAASADQSFNVWPAALDQTITFPALDDVELGDSAQHAAATATSGLDVSYRSLTPETCSVTGGEVAPLAIGTCTIEAAQAGNADVNTLETVYNAAEPVTRSFEIVAAPQAQAQVVTAAGAHGYPLSKRTADVRFTSSAGLPVTVTSQTPKVCTVAKNGVALKSGGTCTLTAIAAGNAAFAPSEQVEVTFGVWAAPTAPAKAPAPRAVTVLGKGEGAYRVTATPAKVCSVVRGKAVLTGAGTCKVVVRDGSRVVRRSTIAVTEVNGAKPSAGGLERIGSVRFDFNSAKLTPAGKKTLRQLAPKLRKAELIVIYGNTQAYGGGDNPANRKLSAKRAAAVVKFLRGLRVKAKATTVATSSRNPLGKNDAANRRADIYWLS
ncbi:OmpA family protein [Nocardioides sp. Bht2]|uniref:OmpA family protein n=1 Tax=Nocardioides sp. Bht2 TaxID=3392297 RepID=UPI0039B4D376